MARVKCNFLGARKLKDGSKTGMLTFPESADRHSLVDLEGDCYLTNEADVPDEGKVALLKDIRDRLERLTDYIESQEERKEVNDSEH